MRSINEFRKSLTQDQPPEWLTELLRALWWDAKGSWEKAHESAQDIANADGAWVHAYLHRKEGDDGNAGYWYARARRPISTQTFGQEWEQIVVSFLKAERS
jgi:hypothetical protein